MLSGVLGDLKINVHFHFHVIRCLAKIANFTPKISKNRKMTPPLQ